MTIPIIAIICGVGGPVLIIWLIIQAFMRKERMRHEERMKMIEKGIEIPVEWEKPQRGPRAFFWGILLFSLGAGIQVIQGIDFFVDLGDGRLFRYNSAWDYFFGLIFICTGLALMYYHQYQQKHNGSHVQTNDENLPAQTG